MTNRTMAIKHDVSLAILTPQITLAMCIVASVLAKHNYDFTLTSLAEGKHMKDSLHYLGRAFDFRTRNILESQKQEVFAAVRDALGPEFDVVVEGDHTHVEWDPEYLKPPRVALP